MNALYRVGLVLDATEFVDDHRVVGEDALPDVGLARNQRVHQFLRQLHELRLDIAVRFCAQRQRCDRQSGDEQTLGGHSKRFSHDGSPV